MDGRVEKQHELATVAPNKGRELNDGERRHFRAVKLYIESLDSYDADFAESLDKMSSKGSKRTD